MQLDFVHSYMLHDKQTPLVILFLVLSREKKLLVGSDDYGRDLTGVQNLRKKHKRLEVEIENHEPSIQVSFSLGEGGVCVRVL